MCGLVYTYLNMLYLDASDPGFVGGLFHLHVIMGSTKRHSSTMKTIAIMTVAFLPLSSSQRSLCFQLWSGTGRSMSRWMDFSYTPGCGCSFNRLGICCVGGGVHELELDLGRNFEPSGEEQLGGKKILDVWPFVVDISIHNNSNTEIRCKAPLPYHIRVC